MKIGRCVICNLELESFKGLSACPNCGTKMLPNATAQDVTVKINWGTLRALVMWAERWAGHYAKEEPDMLRFVYNAADRLQKQRPGWQPLTLLREIEGVKGAYGTVTTNLPAAPEPRLGSKDALEEVDDLLRKEKERE